MYFLKSEIRFSDTRNYFFDIRNFFYIYFDIKYQKIGASFVYQIFLYFLISENRISDIRKSFSDIRKSALKSYLAFHTRCSQEETQLLIGYFYVCGTVLRGGTLYKHNIEWLLKLRINAEFCWPTQQPTCWKHFNTIATIKRSQAQNNFQCYLQGRLFTWSLENHTWNILPMLTLKIRFRSWRMLLFFVR